MSEFVMSLARRAYGIEVSAERATELASELKRLQTSIREGGAELTFDVGCCSHAAVVAAWLKDESGSR
jgi:hypothetical protein